MTSVSDLRIFQGDDFSAIVRCMDLFGNDVNLAGYTMKAELRRDYADREAEVVAEFSCAVLDGSPSRVSIQLAKELTVALRGIYRWDLEATSPSGAVTTLVAGAAKVTREVTREGVG